ncbi:3-phosphoshikimate 1-carboxyvinyltransferase [Agriterribacter sp.]|uniref:3-phosphoshikimate 1-carboxyvinyltransferase n=1 Tax=Agriterribacter sp. TaxID=2821509 RepID=UPI002C96A582|nr:3-phosphoshikimate 1-carboxyvinyltransferase [Agriterribacter sp.]HRP55583.1 3-phosphoshikimate 1-carboxyvinyltransferase [Agriterribacter sp.]
MIVIIQPSRLSDTIPAPASKSSMQRACAAALISKDKSVIYNPGHSNDDKAALQVVAALGARVNQLSDGSIETDSTGVDLSSPDIARSSAAVNCGESGLGIRMFAPIIALSKQPVTIRGEGSLLSRPMDFFDEILPRLNVTVSSNSGRLPITLSGPLEPRDIEIDGSLSSQFLTGLLMAYAAADAKDVTITVNNLKSKPYIDLTLKVMQAFGLNVPRNKNHEAFYFEAPVPEHAASQTRRYTVEGDWSGGAFLLVAGAIAGNITVSGLDPDSPQADKKILAALQDAGAGMEINSKRIKLFPGKLKAFTFDATDCPDLFPPLVALAAYCSGLTTIKGVSRLAHKESNRGLTLQEEFAKMGLTIGLEKDTMLIQGGKGLKGAIVHSRHDHRIAMACAVAALQAEGETTIEEAEAINKSYPDFYNDLSTLGAGIKIK